MRNCLFMVVIIVAILFLAGCPAEDAPVYQVQAIVLNTAGGSIMAVTVYDLSGTEAVEVTDATVEVNDTALAYAEGMGYAGSGSVLTGGSNVNLSVEKGDLSVDENLAVPDDFSNILTDSPVYIPTDEIIVSWDAFTNEPDELYVKIDGNFTSDGQDYEADVATDATSYTIPGNTCKIVNGAFVLVEAYKKMNLTGDNLSSTSVFVVGNQGQSESFNITTAETG